MLTRTLVFVLVLTAACRSWAKNVDLSTVPTRDTVQLTIYNSEDLTLVRETRKVTFRKGVNPLQFSWANTLIDPTSVELRFLTNPDKLEVMDATFPHDKPQMLYWNVASDISGEATIEISYFTSGITWSADYIYRANRDQSRADLQGFVRVTNRSGEPYDNAQIRLVVGTINLVERVAQLARVSMSEVTEMDADRRRDLKRRAAKSMMMPQSRGMANYAADAAGEMRQEKQVIKQGLSEYFIYTIDGTETIPNGWSKRIRSFHGEDVPFKIRYRYRPRQYGNQLVRMYILKNDKKSKLGTTPLPDGTVRVFQDNGRDGLSFLGVQSIKYVPIGDKIELNLGQDPRVIFELVKLRAWRDNLWMKLHGADVFRRADGGDIRIDPRSTVAGWAEHTLFTQRIRNYGPKPIKVEVRRTYPGHTTFRSGLTPKLHDYQTVQFSTDVLPGGKVDLMHEVVRQYGRNAKQNNVTLEKARLES